MGNNYWAGRRVLVTGAGGFIGSHLVRELTRLNCHVIALVRASQEAWRVHDLFDQVVLVEADVTQLDARMEPRLSNIQVIFHLAAAGVDQTHQDIHSIFETNVFGTWRVLQLARAMNIERLIYCGSCFEYGSGTRCLEDSLPSPVSEYGVSKSAAWILANAFLRNYGLPVVSLRPFTVYGPFESANRLIPYTIVNALACHSIALTGGDQTRDFVFVADVIEALLSAGTKPAIEGGTFNICTGIETSVENVVATILQLSESSAKPLFGILKHRNAEISNLSGDPTKTWNVLGWSAKTSLVSGLRKTIEWFRGSQSKYPEYRVRG